MIKANFRAYASYMTDSLYQWDLNRTLNVSGLNLDSAPEVHFSNILMDKAIVRQAVLTNNLIIVDIPNSLLQMPLTIDAHIGVYEGNTFKVVELVQIPVIAKKRPEDYQIEDSDGEIYSFKRLENMINNLNAEEPLPNPEPGEGVNTHITVTSGVLSASGWVGNLYSFESQYPVNEFNIEIALDSSATDAQVEAFNSAQIVGSATSNVVKAFGSVPSVDIPIIVKVVGV